MEHDTRVLFQCLSRSLTETELAEDIMEHCNLSGISFKSLSRGSHTASEIASKLFLTEDEAIRLIRECLRHYESNAETGEPEIMLVMDAESGEDRHATGDSWPEPLEPPKDESFESPPVSPRKKMPADIKLDDIPIKHEMGEAAVKLVLGFRTEAKKPVNDPAVTKISTPSKVIRTAANINLRASCPALPLKSPAPFLSPRDGPSYLRATAAQQAKMKNAPDPAKELPNTSEAAKSKNKAYKNVLARLFAPTANFLARMTNRNKMPGKTQAGKSDVLRQSMMERILKSPPGQRVTEAKPFSTHVVSQKAADIAGRLTTEQAALLQAQKNMFKPHAVPKHVHESRPIEGIRVVTAPKSPEQIFEPFNMESQNRHAAEVQKRSADLQTAKKVEEEARKFRAMTFDKTIVEKPTTPRKPEPRAVTVPTAPHLRVVDRNEHYLKEVEPAKKAKMTMLERQKQEEREREIQAEEAYLAEKLRVQEEERLHDEALDKMSVKELRKSLVFKARDMPKFNKPFTPDRSKSAQVTQSLDFSFRTDLRLGKVACLKEREDQASPELQSMMAHGGGYGADPFMASLRSSAKTSPQSAAMKNQRSGNSPRSSLKLPFSPSGISRLASSRISNLQD
ncbi:hypothetical protein CEUSTIGMA_g3940.t1 [Chlamydomonas eustigma]|uniref:TPX2 C-terminal domain-containing protein n=1 Tax=Chlamydomonas eustigma TaxID=1157962 RepID=A0A250X0B2_9CHLO|nr:hypothetical protein CEUSTIGMA_g3940.t1 [Chlamydomonas eustigma]|eukprot:GAX76495.1 hypothetical protein CEUSTIGMA_g3940.t1 [Chlamydomonas eustigma]